MSNSLLVSWFPPEMENYFNKVNLFCVKLEPRNGLNQGNISERRHRPAKRRARLPPLSPPSSTEPAFLR